MHPIAKLFHDVETEYHNDGSRTERDKTSGDSTTYDADGKVREFSITKVPIIGRNRVDTYDSEGKLVNTQYLKSEE